MKNLIEWALWTPRNALITAGGTVAAAVGLILGLSLLGSGPTPTPGSTVTVTAGATSTVTSSGTPQAATTQAAQPGAQPSASTTPAAGTTTRAPATPDPDLTARDLTAARAQVDAATRAFFARWLAGRTTPNAQWVASMRPLAAPALVPYLTATPQRAIPDATVTAVAVGPAPGIDQATATVTLSDKTVIDVQLLAAAGKWQIYSLSPR